MGAMVVRQEPTSAATVRHRIATDLGDRGFDRDCIDDVTLVVSELLGNAIKHVEAPASDVGVTWNIAETHVLLAVSDRSSQQPRVRIPGPTDTGGRGMRIVDSLCADWGVVALPKGKRVWAKLALRRYRG